MSKRLEVLHQHCHMQGFSADKENSLMYWSFTDSVVKTNFDSMMIAQCHVSGGHLGDIAYYEGKLYSSFMGHAAPGHDWDDWTAFRIHVYDAKPLRWKRRSRSWCLWVTAPTPPPPGAAT